MREIVVFLSAAKVGQVDMGDWREFCKEHASDDLDRLLLSASRYPGIDIPFVVDQLKARRQIKDKLPSWYRNDALVFPSRIAAEQASSEWTALYKQRWVGSSVRLCDLTGGLGVDSYSFSRKVREVVYVERSPSYCEAAIHNFKVLGANNIQVINADAIAFAEKAEGFDVFYIDPARRGEGDRRFFDLRDCEPDLTAVAPLLLRQAPQVIAKLSPMADIRETKASLPDVVAFHVLSVANECKELVVEMRRGAGAERDPSIECVNLLPGGNLECFSFSLREERDTVAPITGQVRTYLYEPNASILKAGAFKTVGARFGLSKLHVSSHLYTSDEWIADFPGRAFRVEEVLPFNHKLCKILAKTFPQANITTRNFPLSVVELRKRTRIIEGGEIYMFATTLADGSRVLIRTYKGK